MIKVIDGYRAQFFLRHLDSAAENLTLSLLCECKESTQSVVNSLITQLAYYLDQMLLPILVHEIRNSDLIGDSPEKRYESFFVRDGKWNTVAQSIPQKYPLIFGCIEHYLRTATENILSAIKSFENDKDEILLHFDKQCSVVTLTEIRILASDRHRGGKQAILITVNNQFKIVYKPTDMMPELVFQHYVNSLDLDYPFDLKTADVLVKEGYGWVSFIDFEEVKDESGVKDYYRRAGVLLSVADSLNYTDGHFENLIANGSYPILIDCETLFHCFGILISEGVSKTRERSILFTGLIQKPPKVDEGRGFTAAFQTPSKNRFEFLHTHAINDYRDDIEVRFQGVVEAVSNNLPTLNGEIYSPNRYISEFVEGYKYGYTTILRKKDTILEDTIFWNMVNHTSFRQVIRSTLYYQWLIRKLEQPDLACNLEKSKAEAFEYLKDPELDQNILREYEFNDLLLRDIPYFYHYPNSKDLFDANGKAYVGYFTLSVISEVMSNFQHMSFVHMERNVQILMNVLPLTSEGITPTFME